MNQMILIIVFLALAIGMAIGMKYLRQKKMVNEKDITYVIIVFGLTKSIAEQMGLLKEPKAKEIGELVMESLKYCKVTYQGKDIYNHTKNYVYDMCIKNRIALTEERKEIINQLILIALNTGIV